ncbi:hypothetical protein OE766_17190 [Pararhizobium sp. YC-54]|uniref:hypothetical protein n=1 Tax=Pararhizobium sp. YC-54 TaxID=2986920 RepID=UPI0021F6A7BF|nr:hypothetical protein [Pararhizobium sp. YC-54]MCV9999975.1 hypothetical protein [Pararhizobium sp. YC-54]
MRKIITLTVVATALALSAVPPASATETLGTILFGHPMDPGIAVIMMKTGDRGGDRAPAIFRDPSAETRARAQAEIAANAVIRASLERRNIRPHNVLAIQTALDGSKIIYAR